MTFLIRCTDPIKQESGTSFEIECRNLQGPPNWSVPDWRKFGLPDLCGPFETQNAAEQALVDDEEYLNRLGYLVVLRTYPLV